MSLPLDEPGRRAAASSSHDPGRSCLHDGRADDGAGRRERDAEACEERDYHKKEAGEGVEAEQMPTQHADRCCSALLALGEESGSRRTLGTGPRGRSAEVRAVAQMPISCSARLVTIAIRARRAHEEAAAAGVAAIDEVDDQARRMHTAHEEHRTRSARSASTDILRAAKAGGERCSQ